VSGDGLDLKALDHAQPRARMAPKVQPLVAHDGSLCQNDVSELTRSYEQCVAPGCDAVKSKSWYFCDELQEDGAGSHGFRRWLCAGNSGTAHRNVRAKEKGWQKWDGDRRAGRGVSALRPSLPFMTANSLSNGYVQVADGGSSCRKLLIYPPPEAVKVELIMFDETQAPMRDDGEEEWGYDGDEYFLGYPFNALAFKASYEPVPPDCLAALREGQALQVTIHTPRQKTI